MEVGAAFTLVANFPGRCSSDLSASKRRPLQTAGAVVLFILILPDVPVLLADESVGEDHFRKGRFESSLGGGIFFSPFVVGLDRKSVV